MLSCSGLKMSAVVIGKRIDGLMLVTAGKHHRVALHHLIDSAMIPEAMDEVGMTEHAHGIVETIILETNEMHHPAFPPFYCLKPGSRSAGREGMVGVGSSFCVVIAAAVPSHVSANNPRHEQPDGNRHGRRTASFRYSKSP